MSVVKYAFLAFVALTLVACGGFKKSDSVYDGGTISPTSSRGKQSKKNGSKVKRANPNDYKIQPQ